MNKYKLYRSFGNIDKHVKKHELIAVEYTENIYNITNLLIKLVKDDLEFLTEYNKGCSANVYAPEPIEVFRKVKRYKYIIKSTLFPSCFGECIFIEYGITEEQNVNQYV